MKAYLVKPCPHCLNDASTIAEEFICGIQTKCTLRCAICGFTLTARTTKKAIKKWNKVGEDNG
jgi:hypothetical protein